MKKRTTWGSGRFSSSPRVEQNRHHDRRAAEMRHLVLGDEVEHRLGAHLAQADVRPRLDADRPGEAPAVAMEHRQRPEIDGMAAHVGGEDIADGQQIRAAMVVDDALGIAGRARRVVERDGVPFVERARCAGSSRRPRRASPRIRSRRCARRGRRIRDRRSRSTSGRALASFKASAIRRENSRSTISALASPWSSMKASAAASRRVLSVLSTAPHIGTP